MLTSRKLMRCIASWHLNKNLPNKEAKTFRLLLEAYKALSDVKKLKSKSDPGMTLRSTSLICS